MLTKNISFINFPKKKIPDIKKIFNKIKKKYLEGNDSLLLSLSDKYKYSFDLKKINKFKNYKNYKIIGMGGSILGAEAIYSFLKKKIRKNFTFLDNLQEGSGIKDKNKTLTIVISKSGNTLETISNLNSNKIKSNLLFITENKKNYLRELAQKFKSEVIEHKNYIGGRYSVLSEVGMLPAELMGLSEKKFKQMNNLIKNKSFINQLIQNVESTLSLNKNGKCNSVILNYDASSQNLFYWYQQLVAESLGKKSKGILPIISSMPKDNHSVMQLYLDGTKNNFFTFFDVVRKNTKDIENKELLSSHLYLKDKNIQKIILAQKLATQNVFKKKKYILEVLQYIKKMKKRLVSFFVFLY